AYDDRYGPAPYGDYSHRSAGERHDAYEVDRLRDSDPAGARERYADDGYDWARVVRVDPVFDGSTRPVHGQRECRTRRDGYVTTDPSRTDPYPDGYYGDTGRRSDAYADPSGQSRRGGHPRALCRQWLRRGARGAGGSGVRRQYPARARAARVPDPPRRLCHHRSLSHRSVSRWLLRRYGPP